MLVLFLVKKCVLLSRPVFISKDVLTSLHKSQVYTTDTNFYELWHCALSSSGSEWQHSCTSDNLSFLNPSRTSSDWCINQTVFNSTTRVRTTTALLWKILTGFICLVKNLCPVGTQKLTGLFDLINLTLYAATQMLPNNNILYSKKSLVDIDEGVAPDHWLLVEGGGPKMMT